MAWIAIHEQIDGPKLRSFCKATGTSRSEAKGILVTLWLWGLNNANRNGELLCVDRADIEELLSLEISKKSAAGKIVSALIATGWLDDIDGALFIHDWEEWQEQWYKALDRRDYDQKRKKAVAEKAQDFAGNSAEIPGNIPGNSGATVTVTVTDTVPSNNLTSSTLQDGTQYTGAEPAETGPAQAPILTLTLNDKSEYPIYKTDIEEYAESYPAVDIMQGFRDMRQWCKDNPTRRKTKSGVRKFINAWLAREQDRGGTRTARPAPRDKNAALLEAIRKDVEGNDGKGSPANPVPAGYALEQL